MADRSKVSGNGREIRLTEERIVAAALTLIDADGIEALSMRRLAAALDVNPMSLYHHVANKAALLTAVIRRVAGRLRLPALTDGTWQQRLRLLAEAFRDLSHAHRDLVRHAFTSPDFLQGESVLWGSLREILTDARVPDDDRDQLAAVLACLVGGLLLTESSAVLTRYPGARDPFDVAVDMLIAGLQVSVSCSEESS
jgi:AcrR family transcriptional regulator